MPLAPGTRLGSHEILGPLGAGGMGEVYRAHDAKLGRDVALKVLHPDVARDAVRLERFTREARAIAALNHPNIVTIYSTEEADGVRFLTMELVEGQPLDALLSGVGLPVARFLELALPLADALAAAHQKQITHRDLKPGNVMVAFDGRVKVPDFGLAHVGPAGPGEHALDATRAVLTHEGTILGTMPYMSPEQVEGKPIDARSDLFSLGVMFYEMLAGSRPFVGPSSPALMSAILRDTPPPLSEVRGDIPDGLARLVARCIEKRPEDHVQTARDVFNELRHVQKQIESEATKRPGSGTVATRGMTLSVAVLPFTVRGVDPDADAMAAGLTEDVTSSLARFPGLSVMAAQAARAFKDSPLDVRQIAEHLGARYIVAGSVRKAGASVRVTAQLIDARSGTQLWTDTYDRSLETAELFTVQDDLTDHIVATVADPYGVLARSMVRAVQERGDVHDATGSELLIRTWGFQHEPLPDVHARLRGALEAALRTDPANAHLWAELANMYVVEYSLWCNPQPDPLGRALDAARRAVEIDRNHQIGWLWQAIVRFHLHDRAAFEEACARAIRINPRSAYALAWMGNILTHMGEYRRGCALTERAMDINPAHPGWLHFAVFNRHFAAGEFGEALQAARRVNMREFFWMHFAIAAACGQMGPSREGREAAEQMVQLAPFLADEHDLREFVTRWYWPEEMIERLLEGVRLARGAALPSAPSTGSRPRPPSSASSSRSSGAGHSSERPRSEFTSSESAPTRPGSVSVAVLPFVSRSADRDTTEVADGLTDDITAGLSRFGYLNVLARALAERLAREETGGVYRHARYAIDGNVRRAGQVIRIGVTLVDTHTGSNVWTSTYDRDLGAGALAVQDDVSSAVAATLGDQTGVLMRAMAASLADRPLDQLTVAELVVRYHLYAESFDPAEHARLREAFERALTQEPRAAEGWACLSLLYEHEHSFGFNPLPDSRVRERRAAERAHELDPNSQQAWIAVAGAYCFARDREGLRNAVERAASLNPLNAELLALGAIFLSVAGEHERATALVRQAMALKPHHAGWYYYPLVNAATERGEYQEALRHNKKINMPRMPLQHANAAALAGHLGLAADARAALHALRTMDPRLAEPDAARALWTAWIWSEQHIASMVDGFTKARALDARAEARADAGREQSIAVLPFADLSETKDQGWFCDGIAEEILNALTGLPGLRVAARSSTFSFRGREADLRAIADALGVATVLQGSLRRAGDRVRITVQLVNASDGFQLWSERYDRELSDIFEVQDQIARAVAERLKVTLSSAAGRIAARRTVNIAAYELYLEGRALLYQRGANLLPALDAFRQSVELDPDFGLAWAGLADAYTVLGYLGALPADQTRRQCVAAARRALALAPDLAEAHTARACAALLFEADVERAGQEFCRALELNPSYVQGHAWYALFYLQWRLGRLDEGILEARRAAESDPLSAYAHVMLAATLYTAGRYQEAIASSRRALALDSRSPTPHWILGASLGRCGEIAEAIAVLERGAELSARAPMILAAWAEVLALAGRTADAHALYRELVERSGTPYVNEAQLALAAWYGGDPDAAVEHARRALESREPMFLLIARHTPDYRDLQADPRMAAMVRELDELPPLAEE